MTRDLVAGIGFSSRADLDELIGLITLTLAEAGYGPEALHAIAGFEGRAATGLLQSAAARLAAQPVFFGRQDLADAPVAPSPAARRHVGLPAVAEAAALRFGPLLVGKRKSAHATCALSRLQGSA